MLAGRLNMGIARHDIAVYEKNLDQKATVTSEIGRVDVLRSIPDDENLFFEFRDKFYAGIGPVGVSASFGIYNGFMVISTSVQIGVSVSVGGIYSGGYNNGLIHRN